MLTKLFAAAMILVGGPAMAQHHLQPPVVPKAVLRVAPVPHPHPGMHPPVVPMPVLRVAPAVRPPVRPVIAPRPAIYIYRGVNYRYSIYPNYWSGYIFWSAADSLWYQWLPLEQAIVPLELPPAGPN